MSKTYETTVIPNYGKDYEYSSEVKTDWLAGKDFIISDISNPWNGKPITCRDGVDVRIRFCKLRKFIIISRWGDL